MKKTILTILAVITVFCLCSCNASKKEIEELNIKISDTKNAYEKIKDVAENVGDASIVAEYMDLKLEIENVEAEIKEGRISAKRVKELNALLDGYTDKMIKFQKEIDPNFKASEKIVK